MKTTEYCVVNCDGVTRSRGSFALLSVLLGVVDGRKRYATAEDAGGASQSGDVVVRVDKRPIDGGLLCSSIIVGLALLLQCIGCCGTRADAYATYSASPHAVSQGQFVAGASVSIVR